MTDQRYRVIGIKITSKSRGEMSALFYGVSFDVAAEIIIENVPDWERIVLELKRADT